MITLIKEKREHNQNCYKCIHCRPTTTPNNCHMQCFHSSTRDLSITGMEYGHKNGWFDWPYCYDPVWLIECNGFSKKEK